MLQNDIEYFFSTQFTHFSWLPRFCEITVTHAIEKVKNLTVENPFGLFKNRYFFTFESRYFLY